MTMLDYFGHPLIGPASWSQVAAWQNAFLFFIDLALVVLFGAYLSRRLEERARAATPSAVNRRHIPLSAWVEAARWRSPSTDAAAALMSYFAGMAWVRAALWLVRYGFVSTETSLALVATGLAVAIIGVTCLLRVFGDKPWGTRVWLISVAADLLLSTFLTA